MTRIRQRLLRLERVGKQVKYDGINPVFICDEHSDIDGIRDAFNKKYPGYSHALIILPRIDCTCNDCYDCKQYAKSQEFINSLKENRHD